MNSDSAVEPAPTGSDAASSSRPAAGGRPEPTRRLYALLGFMVFVWTMNFVVAKTAMSQFPPLLLGSLRFTLGALVILPFYMLRRDGRRRWHGADTWKLVAVGLMGVGFNQLLFLQGLVRTSVAHAAILIALTPVMVLFLSSWIGHEHITRGKLIGLSLAIGGVAVLQGRALLTGHGSVAGDLFILVTDVTFAVFTVSGKHIREHYDGLTINTHAYAGSAAVLSPITAYAAWGFDFTRITWGGWLSLAYIVTLPSVVAYMIYYHALRYLPASRLARLAYLQPFLATLFAVPLLGEHVTTSLVIGGLLVLSGVFFAERSH